MLECQGQKRPGKLAGVSVQVRREVDYIGSLVNGKVDHANLSPEHGVCSRYG